MMSALKSKRYLNLPEGTKVLTPIAGFPTTINPIFQCGFKPVFVDINSDDLAKALNYMIDMDKEDYNFLSDTTYFLQSRLT